SVLLLDLTHETAICQLTPGRCVYPVLSFARRTLYPLRLAALITRETVSASLSDFGKRSEFSVKRILLAASLELAARQTGDHGPGRLARSPTDTLWEREATQ